MMIDSERGENEEWSVVVNAKSQGQPPTLFSWRILQDRGVVRKSGPHVAMVTQMSWTPMPVM